LIGEETEIAAKVLRSMGVNLNDARIEVEKIIVRGSGFVAKEIPFTPIAKRVLEFAEEESHELGHNYIGTEHLLLGLIREREGIAIKVLEILGVNLTTVPAQVKRMLGEVTEVSSGSQSSPLTIQQLEIRLLLKSIEKKTVAIDRAVDELKEDIAALRRLIT
jgi:ATP-dependent Clp protease ATP-binding subunit ClpC